MVIVNEDELGEKYEEKTKKKMKKNEGIVIIR